MEAEAKACRIDAVFPFSAEKIYEYPLCRAIAKENFRYRYGTLQYDERDGEISFRYSYSISHGVYEDELGRSFECVLRSAENSYAVVQKNCVGKYKRNEAKEMLNEFHALVDAANARGQSIISPRNYNTRLAAWQVLRTEKVCIVWNFGEFNKIIPGKSRRNMQKHACRPCASGFFLCLGSVFWWDYFAAGGISPTPFNTSCGRYGNFLISARSVTPERTSVV